MSIPSGKQFKRWECRACATRWLHFAAAVAVQWLGAGRGHAEDHVDYRFGFYGEERGRIQIDTHSLYFEKKLSEAIVAKGELIYDGISGATPNGSPPHAGSDQVPLAQMHDVRHAGNLGIDWRAGQQTFSPQIAYSKESDYESIGISLGDAIEFDEKNTTLRLGIAGNFDKVLDSSSPRVNRNKDSTQGLIGISQLLDPKTIFTADFTYGSESGYLDDPYRRVLFQSWLTAIPGVPLYIIYPEQRPGERTKQVFQTTLTHFFESVKGSAQFSYRFYHDSYDVFGHTAALTWHQKLGSHFILEPMFRYYEQSAASFYFPQGVPGFSPIDGDPSRGPFFSADYRLSRMFTLTYGVQASVIIKRWLQLDVGYHRYEMYGRDHVTSASAYPKANVVTAGLRVWF